MKLNPNIFIHDSDRAAIQTLKAIPGFTPFLKAFMGVWNERQYRLIDLSSNIRVSEKQMKKYYDMLPPICEKLGIDIPDLYVDLNVVPNAYTRGDLKPHIVLNSGLLETLPDELIPTVLAHECGHIACHHVLYSTMGDLIRRGISQLPKVGAVVTKPLQIAFAYWMRCSEFSADRAAVLCDGTSEKMVQVCMYLAGYDRDIQAEVSVEAFLEQAQEYKDLVADSKWDKTLEFVLFNEYDHPLSAVRAYECREWGQTEQCARIIRYLAGDQEALGDADVTAREIPMEESSKYYVGKNYVEVRDSLIDAGFTDIHAEKSTEKSLFTKTGQVLSIRINEDTQFEKGAWYPEESVIRLVYYEPETAEAAAKTHEGKLQVPDGSRRYLGRDYREVMDELGDAGFTNFLPYPQTVQKNKTVREGGIVRIAIGGQTQFSKGDWFAQDARIRITYQTSEPRQTDSAL